MSFLSYNHSDSQAANSHSSFRDLFKIGLGLLALLAVIHFFHIEENLGLVKLMLVILGGFGLYQSTPLSYRLPVFFSCTVAATFVLFPLISAILILGLAFILFLIVNAGLSVRIRSVFLVLIGLILAACRLHWIPFVHSEPVLAVVGSLFMFRAILFLYEERFATQPQDFWLRLSYFFLLPNLVFLIFPVVDYKTFTQNYYSRPAYQNYRQGLLWMANGVLHFLLYRFIYYYLIPNPAEVDSVFGWLQYVIASYALIVRLAGIFHFSAGVICLFGFDLPPTFQHYFFADSFSDLWRRINRYWRDFVMKVFYYPIYFKVKHLGILPAVTISVLLTFVVNWLLHAYQWLWLQGTVLLTIQDISFWAIFGIAVAGNSAFVAANRKKARKASSTPRKKAVGKILRVMGIFAFMTFLWSWWTAPSPQQWWGFLHIWETVGLSDILSLLALLLGVFGLGLLLYQWDQRSTQNAEHWRFNKELHLQFAIAIPVLLIAFAWSPVRTEIENRFAVDLGPVFRTQLNAMDRDARFQGYYETMLDQQQIVATPLDQMRNRQPENWTQLIQTGVIKRHRNILGKTLHPNMNITFKGLPYTTNQFGLRDNPTDSIAGDGILRMALLGGSIEMGSGIRLEEVFENQLTKLLNQENVFSPYDSTEILNFAISGTHLPQHLARLDQIVPAFRPQAVIYAAHPAELKRIATNLYRLFKNRVDLQYPYLKELISELDLTAEAENTLFLRRLRPHMPALLRWGYGHFKAQAEAMGALPLFIFVPTYDDQQTPALDKEVIQAAKDVGFEVFDLRSATEGYAEENLVVAEWDKHPSALAHRLLAEELFRQFKENKNLRDHFLKQYEQ